ncbi:MAG: lytic transglycosylase domain-containing protein, partial [Bacteroidetes bacterium]|nr:lytic transglycosylase domain-containing protein [Fibrella sp.]
RQQQRDYYYLRLNDETGKYIYRILAFKELFTNRHPSENYLPERVLATLRKPITPESESQADDVLLSESFINEVTRTAVNQSAGTGATDDIPLPNAADVFRGGIKAQLAEVGGLRRGQVWVFDLTRNAIAGSTAITEGDRLYAVVEDIDLKSGRLYLRAEKVFSPGDRVTYSLALGAVDASTGRIGIKLPDVDQIKSGWLVTWRVL